MIPATKLRVVESNGVGESSEFGISLNDSAHIMTILRDTLYSDKILAILREYSSNGWDEHRECGKGNVPIKVTLPTTMDPTLSIRDFGRGLSREGVFKIYTQYGASTKRESDNSVGMLGIGSKSGFAYSDSFTIVSYHGGTKSTYVAVLDESEKGVINLLHEAPCGDETGILIQIAVRPEDIWEFERKAKQFYLYFSPRPEININLPPLPSSQKDLSCGIVYDTTDDYVNNKWVAVMGCVPYRIDLDQLRGFDAGTETGIASFLNEVSGALFFNIGEVQISASREELKYNTNTKKALVSKYNLLVEEYVRQTLTEISTGNFTPWERRIRAQVLRRLKIPVPKEFKIATDERVRMEKGEVPESIAIYHGKEIAHSIIIDQNTRLLVRDDNRALSGFGLSEFDYVVRRLDKSIPWDVFVEEVKALIVSLGIDGIGFGRTSELAWTQPHYDSSGKKLNIKHRKRVFRLRADGKYWTSTASDNWEAQDRVPEESDVFTIITGFKSIGFDLFKAYREDERLANQFGSTMPQIYGYKTTDKKEVQIGDCVGIHYPEWSKVFAKNLLTPAVLLMVQDWGWSKLISDCWRYSCSKPKFNYRKIVKALGKDHQLTTLMRKAIRNYKWIEKSGEELEKNLALLYEKTKDIIGTLEANATMTALEEKYQLFTLSSFELDQLWGDNVDKWLHYVKAVDKSQEK